MVIRDESQVSLLFRAVKQNKHFDFAVGHPGKVNASGKSRAEDTSQGLETLAALGVEENRLSVLEVAAKKMFEMAP